MQRTLNATVSYAAERTKIKLMIAIGVGAHLLLIWAFPYPPIVDWPNHMARHYLEARALRGLSLPSGYEVSYSLLPNLGSDLIVPLLLQIFPLTVASRLFLTFNVLACWLGFALFVGRQATRSGTACGASILVLPWLLTTSFFLGFLNYTSGAGLAFLVFVNYLRLSEKDRESPLQLALHASLVALLYIWHLAALGIYIVLHASHLLMHAIKHGLSTKTNSDVFKKTLIGVAVLVPAGAVVVTLTATHTALDHGIVWHGAGQKIKTAVALMSTYNVVADVTVVALWMAALAAMFRIEAMRRTQLELDWLHVATFTFLILYIALPMKLGTTWAVDTRALLPFLICCIALIGRLPARRVIFGTVLALIATLVHVGTIYVSWANFGDVYAQHLNFIRQLPVGARILGLFTNDISQFKNDIHVIAWAVPERQAMVSSLFAFEGQQPLRVNVNMMGPFAQITDNRIIIDVERVRRASFDYVWCFNPKNREVIVPADWTRVYSVSSITVWKIR